MTELKDEVWDNPLDVLHRRLVSHPRKGVPEDALTSAVRSRTAVWTSRLVKAVGDDAAYISRFGACNSAQEQRCILSGLIGLLFISQQPFAMSLML
jgi:hypothetical protein